MESVYKLVIPVICLIIIIMIYILNEILTETHHNYNKPINHKNRNLSIDSNDILISEKTFKILLWTKFYKGNDWIELDLKQLKCRYSNCILTEDRNKLNTSDAVLFHWRDINTEDLPKYHMKHQKWVLSTVESPVHESLSELKPVADQIDWTMTYRYDSDIFAGRRLYNCSNEWTLKCEFTQKKKSIAWIVSNCYANNKRELYVKELQKYIDVDIYGDCGQLYCAPENYHNPDKSCYEMIAKNYKFYLSFENSNCKDYVTEKLFRTIEYDIIPIVFGGANYTQIMPYNSYIDVYNFSSPKSLVNYLEIVGSHEDIYNSYFEWKPYYCVEPPGYIYFCNLCQKLNNPSENKPPKRSDLIDWWFTQANCTQDISMLLS